MSSIINGSDNFDSSYKPNELTLLADYPARKISGTIDLSEVATNFDYIVIECHAATENTMVGFVYLPVSALVIGAYYNFYEHDTYFARWFYTNSSTFTFSSESGSWIRKVYGKGRKV